MVVIIEDEPFLKQLMSTELELLGEQNLCFASLSAAEDTINSVPVALILADIGATDGGFGLLRCLRRQDAYAPAVFISGRPDWDLRGLFSQGAAGYFSKPFIRGDFVRCITRLLAAPEFYWQSPPPSLTPAAELAIATNAIVWGNRGFCLNHGAIAVAKSDDLTLVSIGDDSPVQLIARQIWHEGQISGWLIDDVITGRDTVCAQLNAANPWIAIPFAMDSSD